MSTYKSMKTQSDKTWVLYTKLNKRVSCGEVPNCVGRIKEVKDYCNKVCVVQNSLSLSSLSLIIRMSWGLISCFQEEKEESQSCKSNFSFCWNTFWSRMRCERMRINVAFHMLMWEYTLATPIWIWFVVIFWSWEISYDWVYSIITSSFIKHLLYF